MTAIVVVRPGSELDRDALVEHCRANLAGYKCPKQIEVVAELPRNPMGKVQKYVLAERFDQAVLDTP